MGTELTFVTSPLLLRVKEGYATIKGRLVREGMFFEVTTSKGKLTFSKQVIASASPFIEQKKEIKKSVKQVQKLV